MLNDFFALVTNPKGWIFFWHTIAAGLATASFLILGDQRLPHGSQADIEVVQDVLPDGGASLG